MYPLAALIEFVGNTLIHVFFNIISVYLVYKFSKGKLRSNNAAIFCLIWFANSSLVPANMNIDLCSNSLLLRIFQTKYLITIVVNPIPLAFRIHILELFSSAS